MQLTGAFFQMCRETNGLTKDEQAVEKWLRGRVREAIEDRNNYAHGDWWVGLPSSRSPDEIGDSWLVRIKPRPSEAHAEKIDLVPVDMLDKKSQELIALLDLVQMFGLICLEQPAVRLHSPDGMWRGITETVRVRDAFVKQGDKVEVKPRPSPATPQEHLRRAAAARAVRPP
jgi:hypothetical protein